MGQQTLKECITCPGQVFGNWITNLHHTWISLIMWIILMVLFYPNCISQLCFLILCWSINVGYLNKPWCIMYGSILFNMGSCWCCEWDWKFWYFVSILPQWTGVDCSWIQKKVQLWFQKLCRVYWWYANLDWKTKQMGMQWSWSRFWKVFCGRKHKFGLNFQAVCDVRWWFVDVSIRNPGAASDFLSLSHPTYMKNIMFQISAALVFFLQWQCIREFCNNGCSIPPKCFKWRKRWFQFLPFTGMQQHQMCIWTSCQQVVNLEDSSFLNDNC